MHLGNSDIFRSNVFYHFCLEFLCLMCCTKSLKLKEITFVLATTKLVRSIDFSPHYVTNCFTFINIFKITFAMQSQGRGVRLKVGGWLGFGMDLGSVKGAGTGLGEINV